MQCGLLLTLGFLGVLYIKDAEAQNELALDALLDPNTQMPTPNQENLRLLTVSILLDDSDKLRGEPVLNLLEQSNPALTRRTQFCAYPYHPRRTLTRVRMPIGDIYDGYLDDPRPLVRDRPRGYAPLDYDDDDPDYYMVYGGKPFPRTRGEDSRGGRDPDYEEDDDALGSSESPSNKRRRPSKSGGDPEDADRDYNTPHQDGEDYANDESPQPSKKRPSDRDLKRRSQKNDPNDDDRPPDSPWAKKTSDNDPDNENDDPDKSKVPEINLTVVCGAEKKHRRVRY